MTSAETRIIEREETDIARERYNKYLSLAMDMHATIEELLETVFSFGSDLRLEHPAIHRPLKVIAFNANGILRRCY
jgi:hypothetical protein